MGELVLKFLVLSVEEEIALFGVLEAVDQLFLLLFEELELLEQVGMCVGGKDEFHFVGHFIEALDLVVERRDCLLSATGLSGNRLIHWQGLYSVNFLLFLLLQQLLHPAAIELLRELFHPLILFSFPLLWDFTALLTLSHLRVLLSKHPVDLIQHSSIVVHDYRHGVFQFVPLQGLPSLDVPQLVIQITLLQIYPVHHKKDVFRKVGRCFALALQLVMVQLQLSDVLLQLVSEVVLVHV